MEKQALLDPAVSGLPLMQPVLKITYIVDDP